MSPHAPNINLPLARAELIKVAKRLRAAGEESSALRISAIIDTHLDPATSHSGLSEGPHTGADPKGHAAVVRKVAEIRERLRARKPRLHPLRDKS